MDVRIRYDGVMTTGTDVCPLGVQDVESVLMPESRPQHRTLRNIDDGRWERFGRAAAEAGYNRTSLIVQFIRWYLREPGVRLPQRPSDVD